MSKSWVIRLIIINTIIFLLQELSGLYYITSMGQQIPLKNLVEHLFGLAPYHVVQDYWAWQFLTYMFLHGNFFHIFLNMYALFIFGIPVEQVWGGRKFILYYLFTGIGAGIVIFLINLKLGGVSEITPTIGASGAVFGLLLAFGMLFPEAEILIFFVIPMRAKYLVVLYGAIELYSLYQTGGQSPISHAGHLGGLLFGLIYFGIMRKHDIRFKSKVIKARIHQELTKTPMERESPRGDDSEKLLKILQKLKTGGQNSLNDDEYQFLKYKMIMSHGSDGQCPEQDFNPDDEYCKKCPDREACLLRVIAGYLR